MSDMNPLLKEFQKFEWEDGETSYYAPTDKDLEGLVEIAENYAKEQFKAGQLDCREHGDPRNHAHFNEAANTRVIEALRGIRGFIDGYQGEHADVLEQHPDLNLPEPSLDPVRRIIDEQIKSLTADTGEQQ